MKLESLLLKSEKFLKKINKVIINESKLRALAKIMKKPLYLGSLKAFKNQPALFYLLVDGLNFCFWHPDNNKKFGYKEHTGSVALGYLILKAMKKYPGFFTAQFLTNFAPSVYNAILEDSKGELLLPLERIKILREIGKFAKKYDFEKTIQKFKNKDVDLLGNFLIKNLPYAFRDIAIKNGIELPFCKKLRLLISDLHILKNVNFKNMEKLLVYADYKLPQVFINYGVLEFSEKILDKIKHNEIIPANSEEELMLRAGSIVAASKIKKFIPISYLELDFKLWLYSRKLPKTAIPYHRTLSRFY